jgi:hypothetical protein
MTVAVSTVELRKPAAAKARDGALRSGWPAEGRCDKAIIVLS